MKKNKTFHIKVVRDIWKLEGGNSNAYYFWKPQNGYQHFNFTKDEGFTSKFSYSIDNQDLLRYSSSLFTTNKSHIPAFAVSEISAQLIVPNENQPIPTQIGFYSEADNSCAYGYALRFKIGGKGTLISSTDVTSFYVNCGQEPIPVKATFYGSDITENVLKACKLQLNRVTLSQLVVLDLRLE
ncbi:MAG: hypothetical protein PF694_14405 [Bacteroidetes bacterium]|nr:hypothetical protein [Bacteroidota bacterium]